MIAQTAIPAFPEVRHTAAKDRSLRTVRRKTNRLRRRAGADTAASGRLDRIPAGGWTAIDIPV